MSSTLHSIYSHLAEAAVQRLTNEGWKVHHTKRTHPHVLSKSGRSYHHFYVDRYSNRSPEVLVIYFNQSLTKSLPKTVQQKWDVTREHKSMEVKIIVTVTEAHQVMQLVPEIITHLEDKNYTAIQGLLPFDLVGNPQCLHRLITADAQVILD